MERWASRPCWFTPGETPTGTHWMGVWVGYRVGMDVIVKRDLLPLPGIDLRFVSHPSQRLVAIPIELLVFRYAGMTSAHPAMMWPVSSYCLHLRPLYWFCLFLPHRCVFCDLLYLWLDPVWHRASWLERQRFSVGFESRTDAISSGVFSVVLLNPARRTLGYCRRLGQGLTASCCIVSQFIVH
jgi:hypothetical protein